MSFHNIVLFLITILLISICLYIADRLIDDKPTTLGGDYLVKAILTAIIIIIIIIGVNAVLGAIGVLGIDNIATILGFVLSCYAIKHLLLRYSEFERAVWVGIITWTLVYVIDYLANWLAGVELIQFI